MLDQQPPPYDVHSSTHKLICLLQSQWNEEDQILDVHYEQLIQDCRNRFSIHERDLRMRMNDEVVQIEKQRQCEHDVIAARRTVSIRYTVPLSIMDRILRFFTGSGTSQLTRPTPYIRFNSHELCSEPGWRCLPVDTIVDV